MGSEMCIRDRYWADLSLVNLNAPWKVNKENILAKCKWSPFEGYTCLLYTSDAADERSSVDLGGRRIIKKKKKRT